MDRKKEYKEFLVVKTHLEQQIRLCGQAISSGEFSCVIVYLFGHPMCKGIVDDAAVRVS